MGDSLTVAGQVSIEACATLLDSRSAPRSPPLAFGVHLDPGLHASLADEWLAYAEVYGKRAVPETIRAWSVPDCIVVPPEMLLVTSSGRLITQSVRKPPILARDKRFAALSRSEPAEESVDFDQSDEAVFALAASQSRNYYHWLIETIPRLHWLNIAGTRSLVMPPKALRFHTDSVALFNRSQTPLLRLAKPTCFREVVFPETLARTNVRLSPLIAEFFHESYVAPAQPKGSRLFVSRRDARMRRLADEDALLEALGAFGFELLVPGTHSVKEQASAFAEAECVVGIHGAGLANLAFCRPGTKVIEIVPHSFREGVTSFAALCELFALHYGLYVGHALDPQSGASSDMRVDPGNLVRVVREMLEETAQDRSTSLDNTATSLSAALWLE